MQKSIAAMPQSFSLVSDSATEAQTQNTTSGLIAMAASLVGDENKVKEHMGCSEADFLAYCGGRKEVPTSELERLISLIVHEQGVLIAKHRELLSALQAKRMGIRP